jgi:hypothetical protein
VEHPAATRITSPASRARRADLMVLIAVFHFREVRVPARVAVVSPDPAGPSAGGACGVVLCDVAAGVVVCLDPDAERGCRAVGQGVP